MHDCFIRHKKTKEHDRLKNALRDEDDHRLKIANDLKDAEDEYQQKNQEMVKTKNKEEMLFREA
jgi:hypothetical protein